VPVVSTRISGIPEIVRHNVNGLLVDEKEPDALAKAVGTLLSNPDKIRRFGCAARQQIEQNFNITKTATQLRELVQQQNHENN
jgi:glycosyltransferase involved in cell wall biosynthesis